MNKTKMNKIQQISEESRKRDQAYLQQKLYEGFTIQNNYGFTVYINKEGKQIKSNPNRTKNYKFSKPWYWKVQKQINKDSIGYTLQMRMSDTWNNVLNYLKDRTYLFFHPLINLKEAFKKK